MGKTTAINWYSDRAKKAVSDGEFAGVSDILIGRVTAVIELLEFLVRDDV